MYFVYRRPDSASAAAELLHFEDLARSGSGPIDMSIVMGSISAELYQCICGLMGGED